MSLSVKLYIPLTFDEDGISFIAENPEEPIEISHEIDLRECVLLLEDHPIIYPESTFTATLPLEAETFAVNLSDIEEPVIGEVVQVYGTFFTDEGTLERHPVFPDEYHITDENMLSIWECPKRHFYSNLSISYTPLQSLIQNKNRWYAPNITETYSDPYYISSVEDDLQKYGTYIHPDLPVNFSIGSDARGTYIDFTNPEAPTGIPRAAIHYAQADDSYTYSFPLTDYVLIPYEILESKGNLIDGTLTLDMRTGFDNVFYSELSQVFADDYHITLTLYKLDRDDQKTYLGRKKFPLDNETVGFSHHVINIKLSDFALGSYEQQLLAESLTKDLYSDLLIKVSSSVANCKVNAPLFTGSFAQQIVSAEFSAETSNEERTYNGVPVGNNNYIPIPETTQLEMIESGTYQFSDLTYTDNFTINEVFIMQNSELIPLNPDCYEFEFDSSEQIIILSGNYSSYSGTLKADIVYHGFEWEHDFISTLEPLTFFFNEDSSQMYTKYIEFHVNFEDIPGYETRDFDMNTGEQVLTSEEKSANLLELWLYNYRREQWENVNPVIYEGYNTTFSFVLDRDFTVFEDYYNIISEDYFEIDAILTMSVDNSQSDEDPFSTFMGFEIASFSANVFYNPPEQQYHLNPQVEFDIDITDYMEGDNILEQLTVDLAYKYGLDYDKSLPFEEHALIEEYLNFYLQDKYMEFSQYNLTDDRSFTLTRQEIEDFVYYLPSHEKYYLRCRLEYEWDAILQMNLEGNSKIEINALLDLIAYDMNAKYTEISSTRIGAFECDIPYQLTEINAPNYVNNNNTIELLEDDVEPDIGIIGGFLRNVETRQRLMVRQTLNMTFDGATYDQNITLEQRYNDYILRFLTPTGYMDTPSYTYIGDSQTFEFRTDYAVKNVSFYYYDNGSDRYIFIGDAQQVSQQNNLWTLQWDNIQQMTGTDTDDSLQIRVYIEDQFENTNEYLYNYICDYDIPELTISLGDGVQNFETHTATPDTSISFGNDLSESAPGASYEWSEDFDDFEEYMSQLVYPDSYGTSLDFYSTPSSYMEMTSEFPEESVSESLSGWDLDYNPSYTSSSYNTGIFSSDLDAVSYYDTPAQPTDFEIDEGSSDWNGDLTDTDNDYTTFSPSASSGNKILYSEDFSSYNDNYMMHDYYPDGYDSSYSMNPLIMENEFPTEHIDDDWSDWTLSHDSEWSDSSWNDNGNFDSEPAEQYVSSTTIDGSSSGDTMNDLKYDDSNIYRVNRADLTDTTPMAAPYEYYSTGHNYDYDTGDDGNGNYHILSNHIYWGHDGSFYHGIRFKISTDLGSDYNLNQISDFDLTIKWTSDIFAGASPRYNWVNIKDDSGNWNTIDTAHTDLNGAWQTTNYDVPSDKYDDYTRNNGDIEMEVKTKSVSAFLNFWQEQWWAETLVDYGSSDTYASIDYKPDSEIQFNFPNTNPDVLDGQKDYYLFFQGKTDTGTAQFKMNGNWKFDISNSWTTQTAYSLTNPSSITITATNNINTDLIDIDYLYLVRQDSHNNDAEISKTTAFNNFINRYDGSEFSDYENEYEISVAFDYKFIQANTDISSKNMAFTIDGVDVGGHSNYYHYDSSEFTLDSNWHSFSDTFTYYGDPDISEELDLQFTLLNGYLDLSNMDYDLRFKCKNAAEPSKIGLGQTFTYNFPHQDALSPYDKQNGVFFINISYAFNTVSDSYTYINPNNRYNKLEIIHSIRADGQWYIIDSYTSNTSHSSVKMLNIFEFMETASFFVVEFQTTSDNLELTLLKDGNEQKTFTVLSGDSIDEPQQIIVVNPGDAITFDQFKFSSDMTNTEFFKFFNIRLCESDVNPAFSQHALEYALNDWDKYIALFTPDDGEIYGMEITQELALIDQESLDSIHLSFDASSIQDAQNPENPKLSTQIYNYEDDRWESLPMFPLVGSVYDQDTLDQEFWVWDPSATNPPLPPSGDGFTPKWYTTDENNMNTITFGTSCFPSTIDSNGNIWFDENEFHPEDGENFLMNDLSDTNSHEINTYWAFEHDDNIDRSKVLFYDNYDDVDDDYNSNKFEFNAIELNPENFFTSLEQFPDTSPGTAFTNNSQHFFDKYISGQEFKVRVVTKREGAGDFFCIGDFKTYTLTDTSYLNYDNFDYKLTRVGEGDSIIIPERQDLTSSGLEMYGQSGINFNTNVQKIEKYIDQINYMHTSSPYYSLTRKSVNDIQVHPSDELMLRCKPYTDHEIIVDFLLDGTITHSTTILEAGNTDFDARRIRYPLDASFRFDRMNISGTLEEGSEFVDLYSVRVVGYDTESNRYSIFSRAYLDDADVVDGEIIGGSMNYLDENDGEMFHMESEQKLTHQLTAEIWSDEIHFDTITETHSLEFMLYGNSSDISLYDDSTYYYWDFSAGIYRQIAPAVGSTDDVLTFKIGADEIYKLKKSNDNIYQLRFKIAAADDNQFEVSYDAIYLNLLQEWQNAHDLYHLSFEFSKLNGHIPDSIITLMANEHIYAELNDSEDGYLIESNEGNGVNYADFYYNTSSSEWSVYVNGELVNEINDPRPLAAIPRVETHYDDINEGIMLHSIESVYYMHICDDYDFENYKTLISSYSDRDHISFVQCGENDNVLTPENTFTQVSSDIKIIYSFNDAMIPENVFSYDLEPTYSKNIYDDPFSEYTYREELSEGFSNENSLTYNYVNNILGNFFTIPQGQTLNSLQNDNTNTYTIERSLETKHQEINEDISYLDFYDEGPFEVKTNLYTDPLQCSQDTSMWWDQWHSADIQPGITLNALFTQNLAGDGKIYIKDFYGAEPEWVLIADWYPFPNDNFPTNIHIDQNDVTDPISDTGTMELRYYFKAGSVTPPLYWCQVDVKFGDNLVITNHYEGDFNATMSLDDDLNDGNDDYLLFFKGKPSEDYEEYDHPELQCDYGSGYQNEFDIAYDVEYYWTERYEYFLDNPEALRLFIDNYEQVPASIELDDFYLFNLSSDVDFSLSNDALINITQDYRHHISSVDPQESSNYKRFFDDPIFGKNNLEFNLRNTLITPLIGRNNDLIYTDLILESLRMDFSLYPNDFPSSQTYVEGHNATKYDTETLDYSQSHFKDTAIDNIQMPLITPFELQFDETFDIDEYENAQLEFALEQDISLINRDDSRNWSLRNRLVYYNHSSNIWQDFNGLIKAENFGVERSVWAPDPENNNSSDPLWYLQYPDRNYFIPINNNNEISVFNPFLINNIDDDVIGNNTMKLAWISYIAPLFHIISRSMPIPRLILAGMLIHKSIRKTT